MAARRRRWPRGISVILAMVVLASVVGVPDAAGRAGASVPVLVVNGKGWGHGVGMAQDGALQMGLQGASLDEILGQFYPGTSIGHAEGDVRVAVLGAGPAPTSAVVEFPEGGQVVDNLTGSHARGFPRPVPVGGSALFSWNGTAYSVTTTPVPPAPPTSPASPAPPTSASASSARVAPAHTATRSPSPLPPVLIGHPTTTTTKAPPAAGSTATTRPKPAAPVATGPLWSSRPLWAIPESGGTLAVPARGRSYRGNIEAEASSGVLTLVNQLNVETYLTGMGEVRDPDWPLASLETQAVAARTYALRAMATAGQLCDDTRCQVYLGTAGEYPAGEQAAADTAGMVLTYGGQLADTVYSANAAGFSASTQEGFGSTGSGVPYLRPAPYPTGNPSPWSLMAGLGAVATRLGVSSPITAVAVTSRGASGRALAVSIQSGGRTTVVSGLAFAAALGLRSTLFAVSIGQSATAPPPLGSGYSLQVLPEEAATVIGSGPPGVSSTGFVLGGGAWVGSSAAGIVSTSAPDLPSSSHRAVSLWLVVAALALLALPAAGAVRQRARRRRPV